ncbi:MAG: family 16 glycosylhydrolase [Clostridia bacterium]|nr:family 16 glycosylhydrolase [Clostridia bacterium]
MKKVLSLILVVFMAFSILAGCGGDSDTASSNSSGSAGTSSGSVVLSKDDVVFLDGDYSRYIVVRPDDKDATACSNIVFQALKKKLSVNPKNTIDVNAEGVDAYEILVGNTNRAESQQAMDYLGGDLGSRIDDYIICTIGKKIVINAVTNEGLNAACTKFANEIVAKEGVKGGLEVVYRTTGDFSSMSINGYNIGKFSMVRPHYNTSYLTQQEMESMYDDILSKTGYPVFIEEDMYVDESTFEIVVGNTNRKGVTEVTDHDQYSITISGNMVYLNGGSPHATAMAVTEFKKMLQKGAVTDADSKTGSYSETIMTYDASTYYVHKWGDDFDGTEIDLTKWDIIEEEHYGKGADGMSGQNGKQALRVPEANFVKDGFLYQLQYFDDKAYYGGTIRSNDHMNFLGGYLEHSMIHPDNPSSWNTCWMSAVENNGIIGPEIDLNENFGNPNVTDANAHVWPKAGAAEYGWEHRSFDHIRANESKFKLPLEDQAEHNLNTELHTFGFLWREDYIAFTGDGKVYCDLNLNEEGFEDYKMAFTTVAVKVIIAASPGVGSGPKDTSTEEHWTREKSDYITDYLHIYQLDDGWSRIQIRN